MTSISQLLERAAGLGSGRIAVAAAHDEDVLRAVCAAKRENIAQPILVGHRDEITALWKSSAKLRRNSASSMRIPTLHVRSRPSPASRAAKQIS